MEEKAKKRAKHKAEFQKRFTNKLFRQSIKETLGFDKFKFKGAYVTLDDLE
jgi:hypothetical protein